MFSYASDVCCVATVVPRARALFVPVRVGFFKNLARALRVFRRDFTCVRAVFVCVCVCYV